MTISQARQTENTETAADRVWAAADRAERWTVRDLEDFPDPPEGTRLEIIDGELLVSKQPSVDHQFATTVVAGALGYWNRQSGLGMTLVAPGVIFAEDEAVAPDVVWLSRDRYRAAVDAERKHLNAAPELVIEVLSPGAANERRDRERKLEVYSRRGVNEYWIVDWRRKCVEVFRRESGGLQLAVTLSERDRVETPLLPGFTCSVRDLFLPEDSSPP